MTESGTSLHCVCVLDNGLRAQVFSTCEYTAFQSAGENTPKMVLTGRQFGLWDGTPVIDRHGGVFRAVTPTGRVIEMISETPVID